MVKVVYAFAPGEKHKVQGQKKSVHSSLISLYMQKELESGNANATIITLADSRPLSKQFIYTSRTMSDQIGASILPLTF